MLTEGSLKPVRARRGASQVDETAVNREMDTMRSKLADLRPALVKAEAEVHDSRFITLSHVFFIFDVPL